MAKEISQHPEADLIYSDEDIIDKEEIGFSLILSRILTLIICAA